jgi:hypothetical protein
VGSFDRLVEEIDADDDQGRDHEVRNDEAERLLEAPGCRRLAIVGGPGAIFTRVLLDDRCDEVAEHVGVVPVVHVRLAGKGIAHEPEIMFRGEAEHPVPAVCLIPLADAVQVEPDRIAAVIVVAPLDPVVGLVVRGRGRGTKEAWPENQVLVDG